jgi:glycopeptide antibiotics resistance protein
VKYKITADKWRHFYVGIPMGVVFQLLAHLFFFPPLMHAVLIALAGVIAVSYGFELFSKLTGWGIYDFWDAVASIIGGILGMGLAVAGLLFFFK